MMQADLIAALGVGLQTVGLPAQSVAPELSEPAVMTQTLAEGTGLAATAGDRVTVHFVVRTVEGKELANSQKRGMPFTVDLDAAESFWLFAIDGMRLDGRRLIRANSSQFFGRSGVSPIVPSDTWIEAELVLLKVQKATTAKKSDSGSKSGQR